MRRWILGLAIMLQAFIASASFADTLTTPPTDAQWTALLSKAVQSGKFSDGGNGIEYRTLSQMTPNDPHVTHSADYFSVVGATDASGAFLLDHVEIVKETWTLDSSGNWFITQWIYVGNNDGRNPDERQTCRARSRCALGGAI